MTNYTVELNNRDPVQRLKPKLYKAMLKSTYKVGLQVMCKLWEEIQGDHNQTPNKKLACHIVSQFCILMSLS